MNAPLRGAFVRIPTPAGEIGRSIQSEDRVYQAVTVAAILLVLGSLWVF